MIEKLSTIEWKITFHLFLYIRGQAYDVVHQKILKRLLFHSIIQKNKGRRFSDTIYEYFVSQN